ncbi:MAG: 4Fe-4S binding protein [Anaerolineae bacterium]|nr:4Fe-4S binding protein [Anaerolineae bacterium]
MIAINLSRCTHCNRCYLACPDGIIQRGPALTAALALCVRCGACYAVCPEAAITVLGFEGVATPEVSGSPPVNPDAMMTLLEERRSRRLYTGEPVSREHLQGMIRAASLAPSSQNRRPVTAHVYQDSTAISAIRESTLAYCRQLYTLARLPGFGLLWRLTGRPPDQLPLLLGNLEHVLAPDEEHDPLLHHAPTILAFTVPRGDAEAVGDAWIATQNAVVYAEALGVGTCYNGFVAAAAASRAVRQAMGLAKGERVVTVLTVGYPSMTYIRRAPRKTMPTVWH